MFRKDDDDIATLNAFLANNQRELFEVFGFDAESTDPDELLRHIRFAIAQRKERRRSLLQ